MIRRLLRYLAAGLALLFALSFIGCSGGGSSANEAATATVLVAQSFNEKCTLCHGVGNIVDVAAVHALATSTLQGQITGVTIASNRVTVNFKLSQSVTGGSLPLIGAAAANIRFSLAKLVPGTNGDANHWQSYINTTETKAAGIGTAPEGTKTVQATTERANTNPTGFNDYGDGTYSYQFNFDITTVKDPITGNPILYEPTLTHRVAMQVTGNADNAYFDFLPTGGSLPLTRNIVINSSCNECHIKLGLHGGDRIAVQYCATCHNPGSTDANSGNTVDFKVLIHKIHYGEELPSVQAGGEYAIWGNANNKNDYSTVVFPQDVRFSGRPGDTCTKCHKTGDAANSGNYLSVPTKEACGSCHDRTSFTDPPPSGYTLHTGGAQADNSSCASCHPGTGSPAVGKSIEAAHQLREQVAAAKFKYNIIRIADQNDNLQIDPGDRVRVTFSVTDPTNANTPYNIVTAKEFTAPAGASRLAILIGWSTTDYTNTGSGSTPAQPISINPLAAGVATANGDGSFTVTSSVAIPANVAGSGVVAIEGHPAVQPDPTNPASPYNVRVPVKNVFSTFAITGSAAVARRSVVDINKCNLCHGNLSLHGNNRTGEIQVCVICHNPNATDRNQRPGGAPSGTVDNKREEAIDFKYMIHAIHAGAAAEDGFRENGIVIYGFGSSPNNFSDVRMPAGLNNLRNCSGCHTGTTFAVPLNANALPTTVNTATNIASPDDDQNITPTASVCSSCHDFISAKTHMTEQGGQFDFVAFAPETPPSGGSQADLCGPGPVSSQPAGHTTRTDCCSCHSFK
jgi:OmcA/MtrC family decaheme c-type cytochrome